MDSLANNREKTTKIMYDLMDYGYRESSAFVGLMPKAAEKIGTVGASDENVEMFGMDAKGPDALEVVDPSQAFE